MTTGLAALAHEEPPESAVWTPLAYLERPAGGLPMDDRKYRQQGVPLGRGALESALRRMVNLRLKGTGILGSEGHAEALLVLWAAALTDRWKENLEPVRGSMATDRWLAWTWTSPDMPAELKARVVSSPAMPQGEPIQQHAKFPA